MKNSRFTISFITVLALIISASVILAGCEKSNQEANGSNTSDLSGTITISGSTSVQPLAQILADEYNNEKPSIKIDIQAGGSSTGIKNANTKVTDIGNSSRSLKEEEKAWGLKENIIAIDGIAIVINTNNSVENLSKDGLIKIFTGETTNWKDVGGADMEIIVINREDGSGTRGAFEEILGIEGKARKDALISNENGVVKATVASKEDAIGYMSLGYVDQSVKILKIDGIEPSVENIKSGKYPISRPFLMVTKGDVKPEVQAFLDFVLSRKGQKIVEEHGYLSAR